MLLPLTTYFINLYNVQFCTEFILYTLCSTLYVSPSKFYSLGSTSYSLQSALYHQPLNPLMLDILLTTLVNLHSMLYDVRSTL